MRRESVNLTEHGLQQFDFNDPDVQELIRRAQDSDAADRSLKVFEALKKYKKAVLWAMFLSTSLIMEGYDVVIVCLSLFDSTDGVCLPILTGNL